MGMFRDALPRHLPAGFAGRPIGLRIPFHMTGELLVANATSGVPFPEATFMHNVDKPFEIHRMIARITPFNNATPAVVISPTTLAQQNQDAQRVLESYVRFRIRDVSKNENLTKNPSLLSGMTPYQSKVWEWEDPYTIVRAEGFEVTVDNVAPATFVLQADTDETVASLRIELNFQGYLIVIAPPSETR